MPRLAVKIAYDGTRFSGSQIQPGQRTVHKELATALEAAGGSSEGLVWAGRTDAGVSAAGNVAVFQAPEGIESFLANLTFGMKDAWIWAWAEVDAAFEPRHALHRHYRYQLAGEVDARVLEDVLSIFVGTHDFTSFARIAEGVSPTRQVDRITVTPAGPFLVIDVFGRNFLHNQVRRMVEAARRVAVGEITRKRVEAALLGDVADLGMAPPGPLVLMDVVYPRLTFTPLPRRMRERAFTDLADRRSHHVSEQHRLSTILDPGGA